jgi:biopolymer transport protein ExbD
VIIVTKTAILVSGIEVATIAEASTGATPLAALVTALGTSTGGVVILQADASTDARVVNRIVNTAKSAGFDNVMFAVKSK